MTSLTRSDTHLRRQPGIIVIRVGEQTLPRIRDIATRLVSLLSREQVPGRLWVLDETRLRIWPREGHLETAEGTRRRPVRDTACIGPTPGWRPREPFARLSMRGASVNAVTKARAYTARVGVCSLVSSAGSSLVAA